MLVPVTQKVLLRPTSTVRVVQHRRRNRERQHLFVADEYGSALMINVQNARRALSICPILAVDFLNSSKRGPETCRKNSLSRDPDASLQTVLTAKIGLADKTATGTGSPLSSRILRQLHGGACLVIILWGINRASHLIVLALLGILLACSFQPLPEWFIQRFELGKSTAILLGVAMLGTLSLLSAFALYERIPYLRADLPVFYQRFTTLYEGVAASLRGHGIRLMGLSELKLPSSETLLEWSRVAIPGAAGILGDSLLVTLLALIFLGVMVDRPGAKRSALGETLRYYGEDAQRYIGISAKTNAIAALANLALMLALGVKFAVLWSLLSFFLRFIPNVGFILALVPPSLVALLLSGWKRALLVAGGLIAINLLMDYLINPIFMKKTAGVSFTEMMLSLVFWGAVLGAAAGILAIPLTMALRKFIGEQFYDREVTEAGAGAT